MPSTDVTDFFDALPEQVTFPLNQKKYFSRGLCWFTSMAESLTDGEAIWRESFDASEEELAFSNDRKRVRKFLTNRKLFGLPYINIAPDDTEDDILTLGIGLGKKASSNNVLYSVDVGLGGLTAIGRVESNRLAPLIEDVVMFSVVMQRFFVHPSRIASGNGVTFCIEDSYPSEEQTALGPWRFAVLHSNSLDDLRPKAAFLRNTIGTPDRLWAACLRFDDPIVDTAAFSLVEAGGKALDKPIMLFDIATDVTFGTMEGQSPFRLFYFWQE